MEDIERVERDNLDRVGRKLQTMMDQVRAARTVVKPVQTLPAEAVDAFSQASNARNEWLLVRAQWIKVLAEDGADLSTHRLGTEVNKGNQGKLLGVIRKINIRLVEQGREINMLTDSVLIRLQQGPPIKYSTNVGVGDVAFVDISWVEIVKKKQKTTPAKVMKKAPAVIVKIGELFYIEALQKIRTEPSPKDFAKDISIRKREADHLLVEMAEAVNTWKE